MRDRSLSKALLAGLAGACVALVAVASPCWSAEPGAKNQAAPADTLILPPQDQAATDEASSPALVLQALRKAGFTRLDHVGVVDAAVDADGCMEAPLAVREHSRDSEGLEVLAEGLRRRGVAVTIISGDAVRAADAAAQGRIRALKGAFSLSFGDGPGRWFATKAEMIACAKVDPDEAVRLPMPHAPLATMLSALNQDAVLAVGESQAESKGATWNIIEGELSSDGKSLDDARSSAKLTATLVLRDGSVPWSGDASAEGRLRPPSDAQAVAKLKAYIEAEIGKLQAYHAAHPDAEQPPDDLMDAGFEAITSGDLEQAPQGATSGPSAYATLQAAADGLLAQLQAVLPGK